ncbi:hypothetical protein ACHAWO_006625 [Cyclotella atomus]|uniref:Shootin-1 n=1 Tax=Cyclotella atomus TaxID=382360 RepID=A0ABD3P6U1_9STRA
MKGTDGGSRQVLSERSISRNAIRLASNKRDTAKINGKRQNQELQKIASVINQNLAAATAAGQKLDTIVSSSSDSNSMGSASISFEMRHLDEVNSPRSALLAAADEWCESSRENREVMAPPPPPPPPPPSHAPPPQPVSNNVRLNEDDTKSIISSASALTSGITVTRTFSQSQKQIPSQRQLEQSRQEKADHKKALLSLLLQLKESETSHASLQKQYQAEKAELISHISKQEEHMNEVYKRLESTEMELAKRKKENIPLVKVLNQLSNFAKGCNEYAKTSNSASVKKMSDALKVQVKEWAKVHEVKLANTEEEEQSSMDVIHELQMEIKMLKAENAKLKKHSGTARNVASGETSTLSAGSSYSHGSKATMDDSDEISQMSGVTSMSSCTKMSAVAAFPTNFDESGCNGKKDSAPKSPIPPPPPPLRAKTSRIPPRPAGRKVHIHATPQILASDEEGATHEDFSVASSSPRSIMKKSTYSKGSKPRRVQLQPSPDQYKTDVIAHGFADFDQAFGGFGDGCSEVEV